MIWGWQVAAGADRPDGLKPEPSETRQTNEVSPKGERSESTTYPEAGDFTWSYSIAVECQLSRTG
jgi:hypothetical protein